MSDPASLKPSLENLPDNHQQYDPIPEFHTLLISPPVSVNERGEGHMSETKVEDRPAGNSDVVATEQEAVCDICGAADPSVAPVSSDQLSDVSRASSSSPTQMPPVNLRPQDYGIAFKALSTGCPAKAEELFRSMRDIGRGICILPQDLEAEILSLLHKEGLDTGEWRYSFYQIGSDEDLPGRIPSWAKVDAMYKEAVEYTENGGHLLDWNQLHMTLLDLVIENERQRWDYFGLDDCTAARPHRQLPASSSIDILDNLCDLCIYLFNVKDTIGVDRVNLLRRRSPTKTVNHTDFKVTTERPLLLSIETTRSGVHWDEALLQMGLWHAAQWDFLEWNVAQKLARREMNRYRPDSHVEGEDTDEVLAHLPSVETEAHRALSELGFLPGIIVQGHRWHFVLSTFDVKSRVTTLFTDQQFGSTQGKLEIYAMVAGLRRLLAWALDVYLPWFVEHALPA